MDFNSNDNKTPSTLLPWLFFAAAFESIIAIIALLLTPSESGLSWARLGLLGILTLFFLMGISLGLLARRISFRLQKNTPALVLSALLFLISGLILFLLRYLSPERFFPYYVRLSPLLWYLLVLGIQSTFFLLFLQNGVHPQHWTARKSVYLLAAPVFLILISILFFVTLTKIGVTPDKAYWGEPGVAILGWQFVTAILIGFAVLLYQLKTTNYQLQVENIIIPVLIYLSAVTLWLNVPVNVLQNSFYAPITPPTNIPLPYSDAGFYDYLSQSLLIGTGYLHSIPPRPLYVTFLAVLHFLFAQNYIAIIAAQTCALALFPVALYFLAKKLHSPAAGITVAWFAIFRELVGLWISSNARVANSKIFTTDFPTAMSLAFLCLVFLYWLERRTLKATLITGGFFGLVLLFRTQSLFVLPVIFMLAWFAYQRKTKDWIRAGIIFAISMILAVIPWLSHNYMLTGKFTFDDPKQMAIIYSQYSFNETFNLDEFDIQSKSLGARIFEFTAQNPAYVATFITAHFLNTEIGGLLALPLIERFDGLSAPVNLYWLTWNGSLAWYNLALIIFYLGIIALGLASAWRRVGWLGLIPLAVNIGYALSNAVSRFSSWRYNMPIDWVIYFYFALGIMEVLGGASLLFGAQSEKIFPENIQPVIKSAAFRPRDMLFVLAFMFVGATPWLAKGLVSPHFISTRGQLITKFAANGYVENEVQNFLNQPESLILEGRMLYPRMYRRAEGMSSANPWAAYQVRDYPRMSFLLLNRQRYDAIFPTKDLLDFPQGADITVLACQKENYIEVRAILFGNQTFQSAPLSQPCANN